MHPNYRHYTLLTLAIITFVVTIFGYGFLRKRVYDQAVNSAELLKQVSTMEERKKREQDVASIYSKSVDERKLLSAAIISKNEFVKFIELVEIIGKDTSTKLELSNIKAGVPSKKGSNESGFSQVTANVSILGSWSNVMRALTLLEHMPYSVSIDRVQLSKGTSEWTVNLDIQVLAID